jgi:hypothetical protein
MTMVTVTCAKRFREEITIYKRNKKSDDIDIQNSVQNLTNYRQFGSSFTAESRSTVLLYTAIFLEILVQGESSISMIVGDTRLLIFGYSPLKEVGLSLEADQFHPIKWIRSIVNFGLSQCY